MRLEVKERKKNKLVLEVSGETHTFINLLRENAWKAGCKQASYIVEHPYLSEPKIIIIGDSPKKILMEAADIILEQTDALKKEFSKLPISKQV